MSRSAPTAATAHARESCVLQRLRAETRAEHDAVERTTLMRALFLPGFSVATYRGLLAAQFGFYQPLEARLAPYPAFSHSRSARLARDLACLGVTLKELAALPRCPRLPSIHDDLTAAGCSYVLEGAALGGQVICKRLLSVLPQAVHEATDFYHGHGRATAAHWQVTQSRLQNIAAASPQRIDVMVAAAKATFETLTNWLEDFARHDDRSRTALHRDTVIASRLVTTQPLIEDLTCHA